MNPDDYELFIHLKGSVNYHFCNRYLPSLFFGKPLLFAKCIFEKVDFNDVLTIILEVMKADGFDVSSLSTVSFTKMVNKEKRIAGIVIELPHPKYETECNFVCLTFVDTSPKYYESEFYDIGFFGLCGRDDKGGHINYGRRFGDIRSCDDMWKAVIQINQ